MKAFLPLVLPLMILSFWCGILSTKTIPMDGYPEKPSNTYLVVSNLAQRVVDAWRPKKPHQVNWPTNIIVTWGSVKYSLTNYYLTNISFTGTIILTNDAVYQIQ